MNNARRILSKGSTLLRGCWFWSKKLYFQKNFGRNFIAVEGVRNTNIFGRIPTQCTGLLRANTVVAKCDLLTELTGLRKSESVAPRKNGPKGKPIACSSTLDHGDIMAAIIQPIPRG